MGIKLLLVAGLFNGGITSSAGKGDLHGLLEQLEPLDFFDSREGGLGLVENNKCLALGLEVGLNNDIDHIAVLGEDGNEGFLERFGLDALFEVAHVDTMR